MEAKEKNQEKNFLNIGISLKEFGELADTYFGGKEAFQNSQIE